MTLTNIVSMRVWAIDHNWQYQPQVYGLAHINKHTHAIMQEKKAKERAAVNKRIKGDCGIKS